MAMTVVVTRNASDRVRGFLASCMCEVAPGVYTSPRMNPGIRERIWSVLTSWEVGRHDDSALMTWADSSPGGQALLVLGIPEVKLFEHDGVQLAARSISADEARSLIIGAAADENGCA